jgi:methylglutaconyl-CoA hydratase
MNKTELGSIDTQIDARGVATITFAHPAHNSLPGRLLKKFADAITAAGENPDVRVVIIKSAGERTFCAGASFDELISIKDYETGKQFFMGFANVINAMRKCPKFIIGRVQGKAVGGGVGLASAMDYCMATKYASIKLSELAVGIGPFVVGPAVERKMGKSAMTLLAINATEWKTAKWAQKKGLFDELFDEIGYMDDYINVLAGRLANSNPEAMRLLKKAFWEEADHWDELLEKRAEMSGKLILSDYAAKAISKFKAK